MREGVGKQRQDEWENQESSDPCHQSPQHLL